MFAKAGIVFGLLNAASVVRSYYDGEINTYQFTFEQISNAFATFGGSKGAAWGAGWKIGRAITNTDVYQEIKLGAIYDYWNLLTAPPSKSNESYWIYFFETYK